MPDNVKDLTKNQAMVILNEMFFRHYNINHIPDEKLASNLLKARMSHHFNFVIKDHRQINNLEGWYERARSLFSDGKVFDELFIEKRNCFLTKYEDYLDKIPYQRHQKRKKGLLK